MEINTKICPFETVYSDKCEIENETEYSLSEYMPNIQRIVKTEARVKILDKSVEHDGVTIYGEIVYTVLYVSENSGLLKCVVFKDDFSKSFDFPIPAERDLENLYVLVRTVPPSASSKLSAQRKICSRSKFMLSCEVIDISQDTYCRDSDETPDCEIEYLRKDIMNASARISEDNPYNISEDIKVDDDMPEISDIVSAEASVCIKSISHSDGIADISGELTFHCLYESKTGETSEYVSMEKAIPFKTEIDIPGTDSSWKIIAEANLMSLSADSTSDNFGEQKLINVGAGIDITAMAFKNEECTIFTDIYSTECCIEPERKNIRVLSLADAFTGILEFADRIKFELRGITDIVSSSLRMSFGNPEFSEGYVFIPARGLLSVLGMKENGEIESQTSVVNIKIPAENIPYSLSGNKLRWYNLSSVCRYECELISGELVLRLWVNENCAALNEENIAIISGYSKCEGGKSCRKSGFTLYYPQAGESVWKVAKDHFVSCERLRAENGIEGEFFDGKKAVILH